MYKAQADPVHQRMDIVIDEAITPQDFQSLIDQIKDEAASLQPGWIAAVDLRGMWVDDPFINQQLEALQQALLVSQTGRIGTLLDSDPIKMHLWQAGSRTRSNVITQRFHNLDEWQHFLSQP